VKTTVLLLYNTAKVLLFLKKIKTSTETIITRVVVCCSFYCIGVEMKKRPPVVAVWNFLVANENNYYTRHV